MTTMIKNFPIPKLSEVLARKVALHEKIEQLEKENEYLQRTKITVIHRHGEATALLAKFTRCWAVRIFCRALRKEAAEHLDER